MARNVNNFVENTPGCQKENGVHILQDGAARHYTQICCEEDELARMWTLYPCNE